MEDIQAVTKKDGAKGVKDFMESLGLGKIVDQVMSTFSYEYSFI